MFTDQVFYLIRLIRSSRVPSRLQWQAPSFYWRLLNYADKKQTKNVNGESRNLLKHFDSFLNFAARLLVTGFACRFDAALIYA